MGLLVDDLNAGCSRGPLTSSVEVSFVGEGATIDMGLPPRDAGLCCHFMVFERVGMALLGEGLGEESAMSDTGREGALSRLIEPKPLNSGTACSIEGGRCEGSFCAMLAIDAEPKGTSGEGEPKAASVLLGVCRSAVVDVLLAWALLLMFRGVSACCCCFSGEIDLASGRGVRFTPFQPNFPIWCTEKRTHPLLSAQVAFVCLSRSPLRVYELARYLPFPSSPTVRALISGMLQDLSRPLV